MINQIIHFSTFIAVLFKCVFLVNSVVFQAIVSIYLCNCKQNINTVLQRYLLEVLNSLLSLADLETIGLQQVLERYSPFFSCISVNFGGNGIIYCYCLNFQAKFLTLSVSFYLPFDKINARSVQFLFLCFLLSPTVEKKADCWEKLFSNKKPFVIQTFSHHGIFCWFLALKSVRKNISLMQNNCSVYFLWNFKAFE